MERQQSHTAPFQENIESFKIGHAILFSCNYFNNLIEVRYGTKNRGPSVFRGIDIAGLNA